MLRAICYLTRGKKIYKISLLNRESFYSNLVIEDVSEPNHKHAANVWDIFEMKNLEDYHDINVQSDSLFLAHIFEKKIDLHPAHFYLAPGLA